MEDGMLLILDRIICLTTKPKSSHALNDICGRLRNKYWGRVAFGKIRLRSCTCNEGSLAKASGLQPEPKVGQVR